MGAAYFAGGESSDADPENYQFTYGNYTLTQTAEGVMDSSSYVVMTYSLNDGAEDHDYTIKYRIKETSTSGVFDVVVGKAGNSSTDAYVTGDYSTLLVPPFVRYNGVDYKVNQVGMHLFGKITSSTETTLKKLIIAVGPDDPLKVNEPMLLNSTSVSEVTIGGIITTANKGNGLFTGCSSLEEITFNSIKTQGHTSGFYAKGTSATVSDNLTISFKANSSTDILGMITAGDYCDGQNVVVRLLQGSSAMARFGASNVDSVQIYSGDALWHEGIVASELATSVTGTPAVTCYSFISVDQQISNGSVSVGAGPFVKDQVVPVVVTPADGYELSRLYYTLGSEEVNISGDSFTMPAGDITLHAEFALPSYQFTFKNDDDIVDIVVFNASDIDSKEMPNVPYRAHYDGIWDTTVFSLEDKIVNAIYTPIIYTYVFMNGNDIVATIEFNVENIGNQQMPIVPSKDGYECIWDIGAFVTENKVVKAEYTKLVPVSEGGLAEVKLSDSESSFKPAEGVKTISVEMSTNVFVKVENATDLADKTIVSKVESVSNSTDVSGTAYEFTFTADGTQYNGKIQVTLPYTKEAGKEPVVYYWNGSESTKMNIVSSTETSVTFETDHNSMYVVASETPSKDDGASFLLYFGILVIVGICISMFVGFSFYRRKA